MTKREIKARIKRLQKAHEELEKALDEVQDMVNKEAPVRDAESMESILSDLLLIGENIETTGVEFQMLMEAVEVNEEEGD